jgi:glycosyltransferase involved in cell wall biosynthesis
MRKDAHKIKISAIIPAYNEEKTILQLLTSVKKYPHINEIICVNDGSKDRTLSIIKEIPGIKIVNLRENHGKGYAIAKGIEKTTGDIVIFIDADLVGLSDKNINKLITPLLLGKYQASIGYPSNNNLDRLFKPLSGERAYFKKDLLPYINTLKKKGYGLELYLNYLFREKRVKLFPLKGTRHILKHEKQPFDTVAKLTLIESFDVLSEILDQENPFSYLIKSYFYSFYFNKSRKIDFQMKKLIKYIKKNILENL